MLRLTLKSFPFQSIFGGVQHRIEVDVLGLVAGGFRLLEQKDRAVVFAGVKRVRRFGDHLLHLKARAWLFQFDR